MNTNIYELKEWQSNARRELSSKQDALRDEMEQIGNYMRALDVTDELCAEIDNLNDQLADKQAEIDDLMAQLEQKQAEIDSLRGELLDAREQNLEAGCNQKPTEIHNHFEQGCSAQVFNDKVTGRFTKKKKEKKKWKKLVRKML
jgi:uncharacterized coiled-coil DUF342 family protein